MIKRYLYFALLTGMFGVGAYAWKIGHTGHNAAKDGEEPQTNDKRLGPRSVLVYVGDAPITTEDMEWEYTMQTKGLIDAKDLTPIPELGSKLNVFLNPLKERILANIIERKLLYKYVTQDPEFDMTDSNRYIDCLVEWQETVNAAGDLITGPTDRERLKSRLCEKGVLTQYMSERIFKKVSVGDEEVVEYFNNHQNEFSKSERVVIRQIVLATEKEANEVRNKAAKGNFEELAHKHSIAPEAENGGLIGPFAKQEMPRIFDIAFTMRPGEIRGVVKSNYGFHIFRLERLIPKVKQSLSDASPRIREILRKKKQEEEYRKWVELALNVIPIHGPKPLW